MLFQKNNKFLMLALDHRQSLKRLINPEDPHLVERSLLIEAKKKILASLKNAPSGILLDVEFGLPAFNEVFGELKEKPPFILSCEKTGYQEKEGQRFTQIEYSVENLRDRGALGVKLLIYFNPLLEPSKTHQIETAKMVLEDCRANNLPLFLEIILYKEQKRQKFRLLLETLKLFLRAGISPDVFKLDYPGSQRACQEVSNLLSGVGVPWVLLSRGVDFQLFKEELKQAIKGGAAGFLAGRALWQEGVEASSEHQEHFFNQVLPDRFLRLVNIALSGGQ